MICKRAVVALRQPKQLLLFAVQGRQSVIGQQLNATLHGAEDNPCVQATHVCGSRLLTSAERRIGIPLWGDTQPRGVPISPMCRVLAM